MLIQPGTCFKAVLRRPVARCVYALSHQAERKHTCNAGIGFTDDKLLQWRLVAYDDTQVTPFAQDLSKQQPSIAQAKQCGCNVVLMQPREWHTISLWAIIISELSFLNAGHYI